MTKITDLSQATALAAADQLIIRQDATGQERRARYDAIISQGVFTPVLTRLTTAPSVTHTAQIGRYVRIGNLVFAVVRIQASAISGGSGANAVTGLPFISASDPNAYYSGAVGNGTVFTTTAALRVRMFNGESTVLFMGPTNTTAVITEDYAAGGGFLTFSLTYIAA